MHIRRSLSHDKNKGDKHVFTSFIQPMIRGKELRTDPTRARNDFQVVSEQGVGDVNDRRVITISGHYFLGTWKKPFISKKTLNGKLRVIPFGQLSMFCLLFEHLIKNEPQNSPRPRRQFSTNMKQMIGFVIEERQVVAEANIIVEEYNKQDISTSVL